MAGHVPAIFFRDCGLASALSGQSQCRRVAELAAIRAAQREDSLGARDESFAGRGSPRPTFPWVHQRLRASPQCGWPLADVRSGPEAGAPEKPCGVAVSLHILEAQDASSV